jgi:hypothetical protein
MTGNNLLVSLSVLPLAISKTPVFSPGNSSSQNYASVSVSPHASRTTTERAQSTLDQELESLCSQLVSPLYIEKHILSATTIQSRGLLDDLSTAEIDGLFYKEDVIVSTGLAKAGKVYVPKFDPGGSPGEHYVE